MSFLKGLGGALGTISPALGMITGKGLGGASPTPAAPAAPPANAAASGLGRMIGVDPSRISSIADSVGKGMNMIAAGGGAQGGYAPAPELPAVNNHMQLMDPKILQALVAHFGGQR